MKINKTGWESISITYNWQKFLSTLSKEFTHMYEYLLIYKFQFLTSTFLFSF